MYKTAYFFTSFMVTHCVNVQSSTNNLLNPSSTDKLFYFFSFATTNSAAMIASTYSILCMQEFICNDYS